MHCCARLRSATTICYFFFYKPGHWRWMVEHRINIVMHSNYQRVSLTTDTHVPPADIRVAQSSCANYVDQGPLWAPFIKVDLNPDWISLLKSTLAMAFFPSIPTFFFSFSQCCCCCSPLVPFQSLPVCMHLPQDHLHIITRYWLPDSGRCLHNVKAQLLVVFIRNVCERVTTSQ